VVLILTAVVQAVEIGVVLQGVGGVVPGDLGAVGEAVVVAVAVGGVGLGGVALAVVVGVLDAVLEAVVIGVRVVGVGAELLLVGVGEPVAVGVGPRGDLHRERQHVGGLVGVDHAVAVVILPGGDGA